MTRVVVIGIFFIIGCVTACLCYSNESIPQTANSEDGTAKGKKPLFTFVHITDTHCIKTDKKPEKPPANAFIEIEGYKFHWKDTVNSFPILENTINYINANVKPDFLLHTGDITDNGNLADLKNTKKILDKLNCPYYIVAGDHDGGCSRPDAHKDADSPTCDECNCTKVFGKRHYSFDYKKWHFIMMTVFPDRDELNWLRKDLDSNKKSPVILATHRLIVADKFTINLAKEHLGVPLLIPKSEEAESILKDYQNVIAVLSGHCHSNFRWDKHCIAFISTSALAEVRHQFKLFEVYEDEIKTTLLSADTAKDVAENNWSRRLNGTIENPKKPLKFAQPSED